MIFCCGGYHKPGQTVFLFPDFQYRDRKLEILVCPVCGALIAELVQYNVSSQKYEYFRPQRKKTGKFLAQLQKGKWREFNVKFSSKSNAGFVYGLNKVDKSGVIYQYSVDFNGKKNLVKVIR